MQLYDQRQCRTCAVKDPAVRSGVHPRKVQKLVEKGAADSHAASRQSSEAMSKVNEEKDNLGRYIQGRYEKCAPPTDGVKTNRAQEINGRLLQSR